MDFEPFFQRKALVYLGLNSKSKPLGSPVPEFIDFGSYDSVRKSLEKVICSRTNESSSSVVINQVVYYRKRGMAPVKITSTPDAMHAITEYQKSDVKIGVSYAITKGKLSLSRKFNKSSSSYMHDAHPKRLDRMLTVIFTNFDSRPNFDVSF